MAGGDPPPLPFSFPASDRLQVTHAPFSLPVQVPWPPSLSSCLRSIAASLLPDDDDMPEVLNVAALLPDVPQVLKARIWPLPTA
jgi:hypothetical protein